VFMEAEIHLPYAMIERPADDAWRELAPEFGDGVGIVHACAGTDDTNYVLTCVHITPDFLEANDRYQVARYPFASPVSENILVRAKSLASVIHIGANAIAETPSFLHFRNPAGLMVSCLRYLEVYGQDHLNGTFSKEGAVSIQLPANMSEILGTTDIFTKKNTLGNHVRVALSPQQLMITGNGAYGFHQERRDVAYAGPPMEFLLDPALLLEVAKKSNDCFVVPGRLLVETAKFKYVTTTVLPEQMDGEPVKKG
jgi:hypothetical protein